MALDLWADVGGGSRLWGRGRRDVGSRRVGGNGWGKRNGERIERRLDQSPLDDILSEVLRALISQSNQQPTQRTRHLSHLLLILLHPTFCLPFPLPFNPTSKHPLHPLNDSRSPPLHPHQKWLCQRTRRGPVGKDGGREDGEERFGAWDEVGRGGRVQECEEGREEGC